MKSRMLNEKYMRFPDGLCKAAVFSYDDGVAADRRLLDVFDRYGVKGTFNFNSALFDAQDWNNRLNEDELYSLFKDTRHEIALHGEKHLFLTKVPLPQAIAEVVNNRLYLEKKFERVVRGMAYAYGAYNDEIVEALSAAGVIYARTTEPSYSLEIPTDWLRLKPTCHHNDKKFKELTDNFFTLNPLCESKSRESLLLSIWGHAYEFDNDNNWDLIESLCRRLKDSGEVWLATLGEVYDYVQAYNRLVYSMDGERVINLSAIPVFVEVRGKTYEIGAGEEVKF